MRAPLPAIYMPPDLPSSGGFVLGGFWQEAVASGLSKPTKTKIMPMRLVKLYASGVTTSDAIISYTIPWKTRLIAMQVLLSLTATAAVTESIQYELSLQSTSQFTTAEAQNVIAEFGICASIATAGHVDRTLINLPGYGLEFESGSKLYVHRLQNVAAAGSTIQLSCYFS